MPIRARAHAGIAARQPWSSHSSCRSCSRSCSGSSTSGSRSTATRSSTTRPAKACAPPASAPASARSARSSTTRCPTSTGRGHGHRHVQDARSAATCGSWDADHAIGRHRRRHGRPTSTPGSRPIGQGAVGDDLTLVQDQPDEDRVMRALRRRCAPARDETGAVAVMRRACCRSSSSPARPWPSTSLPRDGAPEAARPRRLGRARRGLRAAGERHRGQDVRRVAHGQRPRTATSPDDPTPSSAASWPRPAPRKQVRPRRSRARATPGPAPYTTSRTRACGATRKICSIPCPEPPPGATPIGSATDKDVDFGFAPIIGRRPKGITGSVSRPRPARARAATRLPNPMDVVFMADRTAQHGGRRPRGRWRSSTASRRWTRRCTTSRSAR